MPARAKTRTIELPHFGAWSAAAYGLGGCPQGARFILQRLGARVANAQGWGLAWTIQTCPAQMQPSTS